MDNADADPLLISCRACGKEVSRRAIACPECGDPVSEFEDGPVGDLADATSGTPVEAREDESKRPIHGLYWTGLVGGVLSVFIGGILGLLTWITAAVGGIALVVVRSKRGRWMAWFALIAGVIYAVVNMYAFGHLESFQAPATTEESLMSESTHSPPQTPTSIARTTTDDSIPACWRNIDLPCGRPGVHTFELVLSSLHYNKHGGFHETQIGMTPFDDLLIRARAECQAMNRGTPVSALLENYAANEAVTDEDFAAYGVFLYAGIQNLCPQHTEQMESFLGRTDP